MTQPSLFGYEVPVETPAHARFRKTDPITSIETVTNPTIARRLNANRQAILRAFASAANDGLNASQVAEKAHIDRIEVSRRASELEKAGLLERTGERTELDTKNKGIVRRITADGLLVVRGAKP